MRVFPLPLPKGLYFAPASVGQRTLAQRGAGAAGFLIALIPVLTLGLGGVELAHWMMLRQALSQALMEAARAGATRQAQPQSIADAFEHGLRMIHPRPQTLARVLGEHRRILGIPWRIRILQPSPAAFLDHADPDVAGPRAFPGQALIRNDYQDLQQARRQAQGWPQGRGPRSGLSIHEANALVMELWWPQRPLLPGVAAIVRALAPFGHDALSAQMMAAGYLPFRRQVNVAMQSHAASWPALPDGRILYQDAGVPGPASSPASWPTPIAAPGDLGWPDTAVRPPQGTGTPPSWLPPGDSVPPGLEPGTPPETLPPDVPGGGTDACQPGP